MMVVSNQFGDKQAPTAAKKEHTAYAYNLWNMETIGEHNRSEVVMFFREIRVSIVL